MERKKWGWYRIREDTIFVWNHNKKNNDPSPHAELAHDHAKLSKPLTFEAG